MADNNTHLFHKNCIFYLQSILPKTCIHLVYAIKRSTWRPWDVHWYWGSDPPHGNDPPQIDVGPTLTQWRRNIHKQGIQRLLVWMEEAGAREEGHLDLTKGLCPFLENCRRQKEPPDGYDKWVDDRAELWRIQMVRTNVDNPDSTTQSDASSSLAPDGRRWSNGPSTPPWLQNPPNDRPDNWAWSSSRFGQIVFRCQHRFRFQSCRHCLAEKEWLISEIHKLLMRPCRVVSSTRRNYTYRAGIIGACSIVRIGRLLRLEFNYQWSENMRLEYIMPIHK